ncbi:MAG: hypothetical protein BWY16_00230 [Candidatus Omnitrophica bacterium ADurb.Bin205]|nr:MAG: hypothetical protein BWY16_00230 [Candidatus Omnitrophica bacterium ADurb.Bin205]
MDKTSSDEKLLRIIEGASSVSSSNSNSNSRLLDKSGLPNKNTAKVPLTFKGLKAQLSKLDLKKAANLSLPAINKVLVGVGVLLTVIFITVAAWGFFTPDLLLLPPKGGAGISKTVLQDTTLPASSGSYAQFKPERNIFIPFSSSKSQGLASADDAQVKEQIKDVKLVGIIWSSTPEVMIEDGSGRTYSLKKGEAFDQNRIKVKDISRNSAVLEVTTEAGAADYILR